MAQEYKTFYCTIMKDEVDWSTRFIESLSCAKQYRGPIEKVVIERVVVFRDRAEKGKSWEILDREYECERQALWTFGKNGDVRTVSTEGYPIRTTTNFCLEA